MKVHKFDDRDADYRMFTWICIKLDVYVLDLGKMHYTLTTEDTWQKDNIEEIIREKVMPVLNQYLPNIEDEVAKADIVVKKRPRWGFTASFDMWLPEKHHIYADAEEKAVQDTLIQLRNKVKQQLMDYKDALTRKRSSSGKGTFG
jgi:hypothetical protein